MNCHSLVCHFPPKPHLMTFGQQIKPTSGLPKWQGVVVAECQSLIYLWGTCRLISWKKRAQHSAVITARTPFDLSAHTSIGNSTSCAVPPLTVGIIRKNTAGLGSVLTNWHQAANLCVSAASKEGVQGYSHRAVLDMAYLKCSSRRHTVFGKRDERDLSILSVTFVPRGSTSHS